MENKEIDIYTPQQELFCLAYTSKGDTFYNLTKSYAEAYGYELPLRDDGTIDTRSRDYSTCSVGGAILMRDPKIKRRIEGIMIDRFNSDNFWDEKLTEIAEKGGYSDAIAAAKHRNELKQRIVKKLDLTTANRPLVGLSDEELSKLAQG